MFKFIRTFDDYDTPFLPHDLHITEDGLKNLADQFLEKIGKSYDLRKDKPYNSKKGNAAWFTESFYEWCEINNIPARIIYFPKTEKSKFSHIAVLIGNFVVDFAYKKLSGNPKDNYSINKVTHYLKYGYNIEDAEVVDEFPSWVENINSLNVKK